jgi:hypothetical protein
MPYPNSNFIQYPILRQINPANILPSLLWKPWIILQTDLSNPYYGYQIHSPSIYHNWNKPSLVHKGQSEICIILSFHATVYKEVFLGNQPCQCRVGVYHFKDSLCLLSSEVVLMSVVFTHYIYMQSSPPSQTRQCGGPVDGIRQSVISCPSLDNVGAVGQSLELKMLVFGHSLWCLWVLLYILLCSWPNTMNGSEEIPCLC